jgi:hypothetical protein
VTARQLTPAVVATTLLVAARAAAVEDVERAIPGEVVEGPAAEEVVETLDLGEGAPAARELPSPPPETPSLQRQQMLGWARTLAHVRLAGSTRREPAPGTVPDQRALSRTQLFLEGRYARAGRLELVISGLVGVTAVADDLDGSGARAEWEPELREVTAGLFLGALDLRIGQHRLPWGQSDVFRPNDVLNPRDLRDPLLAETELLRVPVPMLRADVAVHRDVLLQLVFEPFFVPDRVDLEGSGYALFQPDTPLAYRAQVAFSNASADPAVRSFAAHLSGDVRRREPDIEEAGAGARARATLGPVDLALGYFYGHSGLQSLEADPSLMQALFMTDFTQLTQPQFDAAFHADPPPAISVRAHRNHHVGLDAVTTIGQLALRLDAAFDSNRVFYDPQLAAVHTPAVEVVGGVEVQTGDLSRNLIFEIDYTHLFDASADRTLIAAARHAVSIATRSRWTWGRLGAELTGIVGLRQTSIALRPEIFYKDGPLAVRLGAVLLGGESWSFGDYFRSNLGAHLAVKRLF